VADEEAAHERVGRILNDKWMLEKLLGVGGMGAVYAARHVRNGARAAVKVLHSDLARSEEIRTRFLQEGRAANAVGHPGVVQVIDDDRVADGPDAGATYLVMELLDGESLEDRIERAPRLTERELLEVADAVLDVLAAAHARGVVHRDLKPENLFLAKDPAKGGTRWRILDFGLARLLDGNVITHRGIAIGTPAYMSPEQAGGRSEEIDGRTDLFALGATGFRVLTGRRVHEGDSPVEVVLKMGNLPAPRVRDVAPDVSERVAKIIDRALAFRRDDRYPDAATMRADVREALVALDHKSEPKTIVELDAATIVAGRSPAAPERAERTIELSTSDLEPAGSSEPAVAANTHAPSAPPTPRSASDGDVSPIPIRRSRPSFIPALTALVLGGLVVKLAVEAERAKEAEVSSVVPDAAPPSNLSSAATVVAGDLLDAQAERLVNAANASSSRPDDAGNRGDAEDARAGGQDAAESEDASEESVEATSDAEIEEERAVEAFERPAAREHAAPHPVGTGSSRALVRPPPRKPPHPKHRSKP
jgi:eukaryotic-like serine/threonine-protein kinase